MNTVYGTLRLIFLLSKYRVLDNFIKANYNTLAVFFYNIITFIFYPLNVFFKKDFSGQILVELCNKLGPVYIKFGQTLSTRPDLIGEEICQSLQTLQDKLPPFPFQTVKNIIEREINQDIDKVFSMFEQQAFAAASVAQVHKAKLLSGQDVAVKVLRPEIHQTYKRDLKVLALLANILSGLFPKLKKLKIKEVIAIFDATMKLELNLRMEAANCSELRDNLTKDDDVYLPQIYWDLTTEKVLTTEWVEGTSIYEAKKLQQLGFDTALLSKKMAISFFNQTYRDGFFHGDLHPGNILITQEGKIGFIDFGIMGRLSDKDRFSVAQILHGFLTRNYMQVAKIHMQAGYIPQDTDLALFAQHCRAICDPIVGKALKDVSISKILSQMFSVIQEFGLEIQPQLISLQKSMVIIEGIGKILNPEINMWELAYPWMEKWATKNISLEAQLLRKFKQIISHKLFDIKYSAR
jgi:ubiquinone biosynthesis protein